MSSDKSHAGKMVVNKYAKGKKKYEHSEPNNIDDDKHMEDIDENVEELNDFYDSLPLFHDIKDEKKKYYNEQVSLEENWNSITETIFKRIIESQGFLENPFCIKCKKEAFLRCLDCGPNVYFCYDCDIYFHDVINIFHQRITKDNQVNIPIEPIRLSQICLGKCEHEILKVLCVDIKGIKFFIYY